MTRAASIMLRHEAPVWSIVIALVAAIIPSSTENITNSATNCLVMDIHSRISVAAEIIESVKEKLMTDLKDTYGTILSEEKPNNCSDSTDNSWCSDSTDNSWWESSIRSSICRGITDQEAHGDCCQYGNGVLKPVDCSDIYRDGHRVSGSHEIWPRRSASKEPLVVYCDMEDGGGWTVIQRRGDFKTPQDYFYRSWNEYKTGFGDIFKEFWIGNDNIFLLTNQRLYQLRIDLQDFEDNFVYATYDEFWIEDESQQYILHVNGYNGTAGDSLKYHSGYPFSTKDRDNSYRCAGKYKGAWWFNGCYDSHLNAPYRRGKQEARGGVNWYHFKRENYSLRDTVMKIRPRDFIANSNKR